MFPPRETPEFEELGTSQIYCPNCRQAMPVRKRLLLVLLNKETYDYVCTGCGSPIGKKEEPVQPLAQPLPKIPKKRPL